MFKQINDACPGTAVAISKDSDLAVTIDFVFFWDRRYNKDKRTRGGLYCVRSEMLSCKDGNKSTHGFFDNQFILACVLSGCDYIARSDHARGVGFVTAVNIVRVHKTVDNVIHHITTCGKYRVKENSGRTIRAAMYHFKFPVVYDPSTGSHVHRVPIPVEELESVKDVLWGQPAGFGI